jgi:L-ascorbate metabolism protein UlaG (beta-lactamase superfamily)
MLADAGQYDVGWATTHMFPEQSVQAAKDAHAKWLIPVHWGAFKLSNHAWDEPPMLAIKAAEEQGANIATPRIGQTVSYDDISSSPSIGGRSINKISAIPFSCGVALAFYSL